jgi:hypothetical protein
MKPKPTLNQKLKPAEYVYSRGYGSAEKAEAALEDCFAEGEISLSERPRVVCYVNAGFTFWAIVLTDTAFADYV